MRDKPRVEELMSELFAFSQKLLREHGGFHPFGGLVRLNGSMVYVGCRPVGVHERETMTHEVDSASGPEQRHASRPQKTR